MQRPCGCVTGQPYATCLFFKSSNHGSESDKVDMGEVTSLLPFLVAGAFRCRLGGEAPELEDEVEEDEVEEDGLSEDRLSAMPPNKSQVASISVSTSPSKGPSGSSMCASRAASLSSSSAGRALASQAFPFAITGANAASGVPPSGTCTVRDLVHLLRPSHLWKGQVTSKLTLLAPRSVTVKAQRIHW